MKFTDGLWEKPTGLRFTGSVEVAEILKATDEGLEYLVAPKPINSRGDTLNTPLLTVQIDSPMDDVIKVRVEHFQGTLDDGPKFELFPDGPPSSPSTKFDKPDKDHISFSSGNVSVTLDTSSRSYGLVFRDSSNLLSKDPLCYVETKGQAVADLPYHLTLSSQSNSSIMSTLPDCLINPNPSQAIQHHSGGWARFMLNELSLAPDETIYGLGERFGPLVKNGQRVDMWNGDGGTSSEQAYKNIPFYLSSKGYGVFVNHTEEVDFEVGREKCSKVGFSVRGEKLEYFIIGGGSMKEALKNYVRMTGKPALPPAWTFGLYLSTSFTTSYDETTVSSFLKQMQEKDCPVRVFHFDCCWMKPYDWCSFAWDPEHFPDPKNYLKTIKEKYNVKICVWINPYIAQRSDLFKEGRDKGYFIKRTNGDVWQWDAWQPGMAIVDFTNPEAWKWYAKQLEILVDTGVDTLKTDFGERIPHVGVKYHNGQDPVKVHNYYTQLYNQCVFETLQKKLGKTEAALFARSATAGGQRYPVHWGGDCASTWEGLGETIRGGLSLSSSGFSFWSHDIGGFEGTPPEAIFCRWVAFGLFSSHSRLHGSNSYRVPWNYGETAVKVTSKMLKAKHRLMPYIFAQSIKAHETGIPVMRSMILEFPEDPATQYLDKQYMFGDSLLVAPVFHESKAKFYIPEGTWTDFWSGKETITGPKWVKIDDYFMEDIPVWVRPDSIILLGPEDVNVPDYDYDTSELEVRHGKLSGEVKVDVPKKDGTWAGSITIKQDGTWADAGKFKLVKSRIA